MTKEEIIKKYEMVVEGGKQIAPLMGEDAMEIYEMLKAGLSALRPITREQVDKVFPGCRSCKSCRSCVFSIHAIKDMPCKKCEPNAEGVLTEYKPSKFCPVCGKPLTDEAVQMVMERLEALKDGNVE